jgi:hypothetical protein
LIECKDREYILRDFGYFNETQVNGKSVTEVVSPSDSVALSGACIKKQNPSS